ncbi:MAG: TMEM43 family protein [Armatimonadetes bacterium]|nr:TMEM43 family protein [Armatimonadota bacterium]
MAQVETSHQGWFHRILASIKGVAAGILLFLLAFPLLYWNEGRAARASMAIGEGRGQVVTGAPDRVDAENEGKLVHLVGLASSTDPLQDSEFNLNIQSALRLKRSAEMYQWKEQKKQEKRKKLGGGEETVITYTYEKVWAAELIDSSRFHESGYQNPYSMSYRSTELAAREVHVGVFMLPGDLVRQIDNWERYALPTEGDTVANGIDRHLADGGYYLGRFPKNPQIGDHRIGFEVCMPTSVTVVAAQIGNSFHPYRTSKGVDIYKLMVGEHSQTAVFDVLEQENTVLTWVLRVCGFLLMVFGLSLIFRPLVVVADVVPVVGDLLGMGVGVFSLLIATPLTLLTVAVGWMVHRPLIGCVFLALTAGAIFLVIKLKSSRAQRKHS